MGLRAMVKGMDEQAIERAGRHVAHLDLADHILSWDKKQARDIVEVTPGNTADTIYGFDSNQYRIVPNPDARRCPVHPAHGVLQMHASGTQLMCCTVRPMACDYAEPVSR